MPHAYIDVVGQRLKVNGSSRHSLLLCHEAMSETTKEREIEINVGRKLSRLDIKEKQFLMNKQK